QAEWSAIIERYDQGESLASISRSYHCTAPAIRYIVKRVRGALARQPGASTEAAVRRKTAGPAPSARPADDAALSQPGRPVAQNHAPPAGKGAFDIELWDNVSSDIAAFLVAFDNAALELSPPKIEALIRATDRLVRAGARTRMELERLRLSPVAASTSGDGRRHSPRARAAGSR